jgi:hypothetical protein
MTFESGMTKLEIERSDMADMNHSVLVPGTGILYVRYLVLYY